MRAAARRPAIHPGAACVNVRNAGAAGAILCVIDANSGVIPTTFSIEYSVRLDLSQ
jgi:hypothetical protein